MARSYYEFFCPVKVVAGAAALEHVPYELASKGASRPLVITDKGVRSAGLVDVVLAAVESGSVKVAAIHDDVPPDSSTRVVTEIAKTYRACGADAILAIGGSYRDRHGEGREHPGERRGRRHPRHSGVGVVKKPLRPLFSFRRPVARARRSRASPSSETPSVT